MKSQEGQVFGNYRIIRRLGVGGMGVVYLAEHPVIGKKVALKVIHKELAGNKEIVTRFFNEARAVNKIGNEHIVEINDLGQSGGGEHFFIMEFLEGRTVAEVLSRERMLHTGRALHIGAQIAGGLAAAHACAIIHRDLKPDNIMLVSHLGDSDFVKILDFGLAKMFAEAGTNLTAQGMVLGTPQYMSPEACESKKDIDHRADIYSLGILLFQMVTGQLPFDGHTMGEVMVKQVTHAPPPPRAINPGIPPSVEQIILRCLAKSPAARFSTMEELRRALLDPDRYLASGPPIIPSAVIAGQSGQIARPSESQMAEPRGGQRGDPAAGPLSGSLSIPDAGAAGSTPELNLPVLPENRTMRIDTPVGYRARRRWPLLTALSAVVAVSGVTALVVLADGGSRVPSADTAAGTGLGGVTYASIDAAVAEPELPAIGTMTISTEPAGAEVLDEQGRLLGQTPAEIRLPMDAQEHVLVFRHPMAKELKKSVVCTGDGELVLELELIDTSRKRRGSRRDKKSGSRRPARDQLIDMSGSR